MKNILKIVHEIFGTVHELFVHLNIQSNKQIYRMKLTAKAIGAIDNQKTKIMIALALGFKEQWIDRVVKKNKNNGWLTTAKALQVIREETGLSDQEILEEEKVEQQ